ncbi:hypothetical protein halTADL_0968 [Halohasta litchfieldiae]|jgi:hypothetical protein|uniref:Uncharacterized protein n=1 Tax=Halohasta litchfieldiae TaxID=1073996 RepID=A0A1H6T8A4_9EURY|nr:hypothetical protein [Halohasta litchfieldiae]ATW87764.1 hypothetical protein halTADL_0968 [Halohasta litchfieldiae]SEI74384.1 hypothetical protein SAMN05444271_10712 [Halohasta litchfieldiae]
MRTVSDVDGNRYLLLKQSSDASLVRDPETGTEQYVDNGQLESLDGESPLVTAAAAIDSSVRRLLTATHNDRSLGLLVELVDRGPCSTIELLNGYGLCESDLHGLLTEFRAAGLVEEATSHGERGYDATDLAETAVNRLRTPSTES